jgi:glycosyltransferase involved in cell wall biosynthesis
MISVCMATYNGEKFLVDQINSILPQLSADDELIILDDCSIDRTWEIINSYIDSRIKAFQNERNIGVNKSFEKLINFAKGEFIFLSDQDDVWVHDRVQLLLDELKSAELVSSSFDFIDSRGIKFDDNKFSCLKKVNSKRHFKNLFGIFFGSANYYGCAMAFKKSLKLLILPIPAYVESHDLWIAMAANIRRSVIHLEVSTLLRRIHGANVSVINRSIISRIYSRFFYLLCICNLLHRNKLRRVK